VADAVRLLTHAIPIQVVLEDVEVFILYGHGLGTWETVTASPRVVDEADDVLM
jgi:hypothetical protein